MYNSPRKFNQVLALVKELLLQAELSISREGGMHVSAKGALAIVALVVLIAILVFGANHGASELLGTFRMP